jgi:hypothetical protein
MVHVILDTVAASVQGVGFLRAILRSSPRHRCRSCLCSGIARKGPIDPPAEQRDPGFATWSRYDVRASAHHDRARRARRRRGLLRPLRVCGRGDGRRGLWRALTRAHPAGLKSVPKADAQTGGYHSRSESVYEHDLINAPDPFIFDWAREANFAAVVSADRDFVHPVERLGPPPKVIRIEHCDFPVGVSAAKAPRVLTPEQLHATLPLIRERFRTMVLSAGCLALRANPAACKPYHQEQIQKRHIRPAGVTAGLDGDIGWHTLRHS